MTRRILQECEGSRSGRAQGGRAENERARGERGFALLMVLLALVPLSLLFAVLVGSARSDARSAADLRVAAVLSAAADGAVNTALFDMLAHGARAGRSVTRVAGIDVVVETESLSGLANPNTAGPELLAALIARVGAEPVRARYVAGAIVDWRTTGQRPGPRGAKVAEYLRAGLDYGPPGAPFESLDEVGLVAGMTPALLVALAPHLSLYAYGDPDPRVASPVVRAALADTGVVRSLGRLEAQVIRITAAAVAPGGGQSVRRAVIRLGPSANGRGWRVLAWGGV